MREVSECEKQGGAKMKWMMWCRKEDRVRGEAGGTGGGGRRGSVINASSLASSKKRVKKYLCWIPFEHCHF